MLDDRVLSVLARLEAEDSRESSSDIPPEQRSLACGPDSGRVLFALAAMCRGCRVLEIGASRGYSSIWLAAGARISGGSVVSLEQEESKVAAWQENVAEAGVDSHAVLIEGDALRTLSRLQERFDLVFLDAWKADYELYFTAVRELAAPGAVVVADNVASHTELASYVARRQADPSLSSVTLPVGSGLELTTLLTVPAV
jgi:predicted O-methyltransferase YrrM